MFTRKLIVAWLSSSWFTLLFATVLGGADFGSLFVCVLFIAGIVTLFYGIPASLLIDLVTKKWGLLFLPKLLIYGFFGAVFIWGYSLWCYFNTGTFIYHPQEDLLYMGIGMVIALLGGLLDDQLVRRESLLKNGWFRAVVAIPCIVLLLSLYPLVLGNWDFH